MLTAYELEQRKKVIGASDVSAVLGINPYRTPFEVYAEKTGKLDSFEGNKQTDAGNRFEPVILDWAEEQLGLLNRRLAPSKLPGLPVASNCDAILAETGVPVEAKSAGLFGPLSDAWGDEGSDVVPDYYLVQVQTQILCTGADFAYVAAFLGGRGFTMFRINRSEKICGFLRSYLPDWWNRHVVADVPPELGTTSLEVLKRLKREPNKVVEIPSAVAMDFSAACIEVKLAEKREKDAKFALLAAMGDAEAADFGDPERMLTFYAQTRRAHEVKESTFRVLRFSKRSSL